ncbi:ASCH domain-containing protein [Streptomyces sp. NPDC005202]|uniref:ASCH domain-containing protein n=1 Tax=Streptomyces sp. NPDC005202 TaxID=3157021 RepID=UPI0033A5FC01
MKDTQGRVRNLNLYRQYFDLVAAGDKTVEVRVKYLHLADLAAGDTIRFHIKGAHETCEVVVKRVTEYDSFDALLDGAGPASRGVRPARWRRGARCSTGC